MKAFQQFLSRHRTRITACLLLGAIVLLLGLNLLVTYAAAERSWYIDTTEEGLYTLSEPMRDACDALFSRSDVGQVQVTFCADPDTLNASIASRVVYRMMLQLERRYPNVHIREVNVAQNPTAVSRYKTSAQTSIKTTDMILEYGDRYRVVAIESFWAAGADDVYTSFRGEYRLLNVLYSLLAIERPCAYFITGHGETVYETDPTKDTSTNARAAALYELLLDQGLCVRTLDLSDEAAVIPSDCSLLIINNPTSDFSSDPDRYGDLDYQTALDKINEYLVERQGALMVAKDYRRQLPTLEAFLREWGFVFSNVSIRDEEHSVENEEGTFTHLLGQYDTTEGSYASAIYGEVAALDSAAATVFKDPGYISSSFRAGGYRVEEHGEAIRTLEPLFRTYETARSYAYNDVTHLYDRLYDRGAHVIAATSLRTETDPLTDEKTYSHVFCTSSGEFFSTEYLGRAAYANYDVVSLLVADMTELELYADSNLGGSSFNATTPYGKWLISTAMSAESVQTIYGADGGVLMETNILSTAKGAWITVVIVAVPVLCALGGVGVYVRRRFL